MEATNVPCGFDEFRECESDNSKIHENPNNNSRSDEPDRNVEILDELTRRANPPMKIVAEGETSTDNRSCDNAATRGGKSDDGNSGGPADREIQEKSDDTQVHNSPAPLAFTIDFGNNKDVDTARYQNLFQRYNARHRRNLSTSKIEIKNKKPPVVSSSNFHQKLPAPSAHSEGYFSSEDSSKRKTDQLSQKLKELGLRVTRKSQGIERKSDVMSKSYTERSYKDSRGESCGEETEFSSSRDNFSLELNYNSRASTSNNFPYSATMNDLSSVQKNSYFDDELTNCVRYSPEKKYTKNIEYIEIDRDYKNDECNEESGGSEKLSNVDCANLRSNEFGYVEEYEKKMGNSRFNAELDDSGTINLDIFNVSNADAGSDGTVSEAGTYTIHKDYTDEEKARMDIDKVFSVGVFADEERDQSYVHHFKMSSSRDSNTWISEWATQVAEHNSLPPPVGGSTGRTPPLSPSKIPSPIYSRNQRTLRSRQEQSDSSLDMDSHLHIKERVGTVGNQHTTLIDSGGESDEDTSNSYVTPPLSSQRTPTHGPALVRRGSLSDSLLKRVNANECCRSVRKYVENKISKNDDCATKSPIHAFNCLSLERSSSLDRKEYTSDTPESNSSRKSSLKNHATETIKHCNSPILNRLRSSAQKLTNSPILSHKELSKKGAGSPVFEKSLNLSGSHGDNVGYFTCTENSPYMLRKSNSTSNYHEESSLRRRRELTSSLTGGIHATHPKNHENANIQRCLSNTSIRNSKSKSVLARRGSFNNNNEIDRSSKGGKLNNAPSDSSSDTGEQSTIPVAPISTGIKLNRAFSIRRGRLNCESDTALNTTAEERRKKGQTEVKSAPCSARQTGHYRGRTSSVGSTNKEIFKKPDPPKPRTLSISRIDTGRFSMRAPKTSHSTSASRPTQKSSKEHKKSTRSNSTLTSKEVEFQNWKRRKSYDPMKAAAEGKKKVELPKKQNSVENGSSSRDNSVLRSASFHGTHGTLSLADDWSDNELEFGHKNVHAPPPPCSPQLASDSDLETSSYLQTTRNVMSAMSARIYNPGLVDSGGESDEDTSHSFRQGGNKLTREASDTESSDEPQAATQPQITNTKYNRAFSLRRGRLEPQETKTSSTTTKPKILSANNAKGKIETVPSIARTDSGRFSMRLPKNSPNTSKLKPKETKKQAGPNNREVEMQNWKRRKSYDPMKAAMEGKRKAGFAKRNANENSSSSHVSRSQSFHGPATLGISEWSDEEVSASADEAPVY